MDNATIIGRFIAATDHEAARAICRQFRPTIKRPQLVEQIYQTILANHPDVPEQEIRDMFIAASYQLYQPLSFLNPFKSESDKARKAVGKLPPGVRDEIARCLSLTHPEEVSRYKGYIEPFMKPESVGVERPFRTKVMAIVEMFKKYSINADDFQTELF